MLNCWWPNIKRDVRTKDDKPLDKREIKKVLNNSYNMQFD